MLKKYILLAAAVIGFGSAFAQDEEKKEKWQSGLTPAQKLIANTGEDLLTGGNAGEASTVISGYGEMSFKRNVAYKSSKASLDRVVLFVGHQFSSRISFFSELEVADARVEGGSILGEIGMEQAFLKYSLNPRQYFIAGLITPRIGITNENHLPTNFNGTERPQVEQFVIPTTWRELGVGFYGQMSKFPIAYSIAIMNGLDAQKFQHGFGIGKGSGGGQSVAANNMAITGSLRAYWGDFQVQVSGYYGGSIGLSPFVADSLGIEHGAFAAPITMGEANVQYAKDGFNFKLLGAYIYNPKASDINRTFANNTAEQIYGMYAELSYDVLNNAYKENMHNKSLIGFVRYERLNLNAGLPENGIIDGTLDQHHAIAGLGFFPVPNVAIKADVRYTHTGAFNKNLLVNPAPMLRPYAEDNYTISVGLGYSF